MIFIFFQFYSHGRLIEWDNFFFLSRVSYLCFSICNHSKLSEMIWFAYVSFLYILDRFLEYCGEQIFYLIGIDLMLFSY